MAEKDSKDEERKEMHYEWPITNRIERVRVCPWMNEWISVTLSWTIVLHVPESWFLEVDEMTIIISHCRFLWMIFHWVSPLFATQNIHLSAMTDDESMDADQWRWQDREVSFYEVQKMNDSANGNKTQTSLLLSWSTYKVISLPNLLYCHPGGGWMVVW